MTITLPLTVIIPRKTKADKVFALNLNIYRNSHHMTLNQAKVAYKEEVMKAMAVGGRFVPLQFGAGPFKFVYTIFPSSNRGFDLGNVCSIIQKFTDDALIELGAISDDNFKVVRAVDYRFGSVDKIRPRAELTILRLI
jgi:hypothetical protein